MRLSPRRRDEAIREQGLQGLLFDLDCLFRRIMVCYDIATSYGGGTPMYGSTVGNGLDVVGP